jgi:hypothetical protein
VEHQHQSQLVFNAFMQSVLAVAVVVEHQLPMQVVVEQVAIPLDGLT